MDDVAVVFGSVSVMVMVTMSDSDWREFCGQAKGRKWREEVFGENMAKNDMAGSDRLPCAKNHMSLPPPSLIHSP